MEAHGVDLADVSARSQGAGGAHHIVEVDVGGARDGERVPVTASDLADDDGGEGAEQGQKQLDPHGDEERMGQIRFGFRSLNFELRRKLESKRLFSPRKRKRVSKS